MAAINLADRGNFRKREIVDEEPRERRIERKLKYNFDNILPPVNEKDMGMSFRGKPFKGLF